MAEEVMQQEQEILKQLEDEQNSLRESQLQVDIEMKRQQEMIQKRRQQEENSMSKVEQLKMQLTQMMKQRIAANMFGFASKRQEVVEEIPDMDKEMAAT